MRRHGRDLFSYSAVYRLCSLSHQVNVQRIEQLIYTWRSNVIEDCIVRVLDTGVSGVSTAHSVLNNNTT